MAPRHLVNNLVITWIFFFQIGTHSHVGLSLMPRYTYIFCCVSHYWHPTVLIAICFPIILLHSSSFVTILPWASRHVCKSTCYQFGQHSSLSMKMGWVHYLLPRYETELRLGICTQTYLTGVQVTTPAPIRILIEGPQLDLD